MVVQISIGKLDSVKILSNYENVFYPSASLISGLVFINHTRTICCVAHDGFPLELKISGCGTAEIKGCTVPSNKRWKSTLH